MISLWPGSSVCHHFIVYNAIAVPCFNSVFVSDGFGDSLCHIPSTVLTAPDSVVQGR